MIAQLYRRWCLEPWIRLDQEAAVERAGTGFDTRVAILLIVAALVLVFEEYFGDRPNFDQVFERYAALWRYYQLGSFAWWSAAKLIGYLLVPVACLSALRLDPRDCGLTFAGFRRHVWIYAALYLAILPVLVGVSFTRAFQDTYPFYKLAARSWLDFLLWEAMYASTFLGLEFFFRGFLLFPLKRAFGSYAIFVAVLPYCMLHFHKPLAEVIGAIFAGILLGTLALVTRSIWCGVLIHVSVAWTMDVLAMVQVYGLPGSARGVRP
jgi:hypothetical protein